MILIQFICQFHHLYGVVYRQFRSLQHLSPSRAAVRFDCLRWLPHSECNGLWQRVLRQFWDARLLTQPTKELSIDKNMLKNKLRYLQNAVACYPGRGWFGQVHIALGMRPQARLLTNQLWSAWNARVFCRNLSLYILCISSAKRINSTNFIKPVLLMSYTQLFQYNVYKIIKTVKDQLEYILS